MQNQNLSTLCTMAPSQFDRRKHAPAWVIEIDWKEICTGKACAEMVEIWLLMCGAMIHIELSYAYNK